MNEAKENISCELTKIAALLKKESIEVNYKRRQKPRLGTVSNIELLRMVAYRGASLVLNFYSGERTGLVVRASDSGSGEPGSILGRVGVLFP